MSDAGTRLEREGHNSDGRCEKCWREAATLYANSPEGAFESLRAAYYEVMRRAEAMPDDKGRRHD